MEGAMKSFASVTLISSILAVQSQFSGPFISSGTQPSVGMLPLNVDGPQGGPTIVPKFTVSFSSEMHDPTLPFSTASGRLVYDADLQVYRIDCVSELEIFGPGAIMNSSQIALDGAMSSFTNGQCFNITGPFASGGFSGLFGWLKVATKIGQDVLEGRHCDLWSHSMTTMNRTWNLSACLDGDEPVYMFMPLMGPPRKTIFKPDLIRTADRNLLQVPDTCKSVPKPCGDNTIAKQLVYVAHPRNNYNISGQDLADARGDAVFLCIDKMMWEMGGYQLLSVFELSMVQAFGQYTNYPPPGNHGFGGDGFHVGRSTPVSVGRHGGQCADDADWWARIGQWFSLPPDGQCKGAKQQLGVDCTWRVERRVKTVEMACLFKEHHMLHHCSQAHGDFSNVTNILLNAVASEQIDQGGCPSVKAPQCSVHPACTHLSGDCCPHQDGTFLDCCSQTPGAVETVVV